MLTYGILLLVCGSCIRIYLYNKASSRNVNDVLTRHQIWHNVCENSASRPKPFVIRGTQMWRTGRALEKRKRKAGRARASSADGDSGEPDEDDEAEEVAESECDRVRSRTPV